MITDILDNSKKEFINKVSTIPLNRIEIENYLYTKYYKDFNLKKINIDDSEYSKTIDLFFEITNKENIIEKDRWKQTLNFNEIDIDKLDFHIKLKGLIDIITFSKELNDFYTYGREFPIFLIDGLKEILWEINLKLSQKDCALESDHNNITPIKTIKFHHEEILKAQKSKVEKYIDEMPIKIIEIVKSNSVFGRNFNYVHELYQELISEFIEESIVEEIFIKNFIYPDINCEKIDLTNGSLIDFAYLINKLRPFFIEEIRTNPTTYNQWWSNNFLFKGKEKTSRDISKIISKLINEEQSPKRIEVTNSIVEIFKNLVP
ncbi:hypothetical protein VOI54_00740 [Tamlana sp. 2201CG12-4]|uniref:hypothetical protein n=1 Tax=Tamlana sp. 2201CG12-4 TaxID=3112582 RepID=UPI002DBB2F6F|nr:hypothetical protein [Tamlana sp. 2201CG12-4]MEC3905534.1 hypothetical protein [Tamlana sp. 2201CG12-4]